MEELAKYNTKELATVQVETLTKYLDAQGLSKSLTNEEKTTFLEICLIHNLNPFKREIYCNKYGTQTSIVTGFEVYLKRAERTGKLDGFHVETFGKIEDNSLFARVTIHRKDWSRPFIHDVYYCEYVQKTKEGQINKFWREKPITMIKKVALSQGFRLCFSDELGGMPYTQDEMPTIDVPHVVVNTTPIQKPDKLSEKERLLKAIEKAETIEVLEKLEMYAKQYDCLDQYMEKFNSL